MMSCKLCAAGLCWVMGTYAHAGIQDLIDAATDGDVIVIPPGTYNETIDFLGKTITVRSAQGPDITIIDGSGIGGSVVSCVHEEGKNTVLDGFTIRGGGWSGMAIQASPTVIDCVFLDNWHGAVLHGGGMTVHSGAPTITNCTFRGNEGGSAGGLMVGELADVVVDGCTFLANFSDFGSGGMYISGSATVKNCLFSENSTSGHGGGLSVVNSSPTVINCVFTGNTAFAGGAIACSPGEPIFVNCSIYCNVADVAGGVVNDGAPVLVNCTMYGNTSTLSGVGGGMHSGGGLPRMHNCILRNSSPPQIQDDGGALIVTYSNVEGGWTGVGSHNIDADPMFVDELAGDFRLVADSPCIDAGNNWSLPTDVPDLDEDGDISELTPIDLLGSPRFNADETKLDAGCGSPVVVDMGPHEYQFDAAGPIYLGDLNVDGIVDAADLAILLGAWGTCVADCCLADLNVSGTVDAADLAVLLGTW